MTTFGTIEVDFDVHKIIEAERQNFDDPPNSALRRLLGIDGEATNESSSGSGKPPDDMSGRAWSGKGITLPHGTKLRMEYNGREILGEIGQGYWLVEGGRYSSPSDAAGSTARTKSGDLTNLNGWNYWEVKRPQDPSWIRLNRLRK